MSTLLDLATRRSEVAAEHLCMPPHSAKQLLHTVVCGGAPPPKFESNAYLKKVNRLGRFFRWLAIALMPNIYETVSKDHSIRWPEASCFAYLWQSVEDHILEAWLQKIADKPGRHCSLHFDGIRLDRGRLGDGTPEAVEACCREFEQAILEQTGYKVRIETHKKHSIRNRPQSDTM